VDLLVVLDCADAEALAVFWTAALGVERGPYTAPYLRLTHPEGRWPDLLLQEVPEPKTGKNRMHFDLLVPEVEADVERLVALGATVLTPAHDDEGFRLAVLADPQGNEFCVVRPPTPLD
jgi:predicted enzyme related to lactoylglutathione lyase